MTDKFYFALSIFLFATFPLITVGQDPIYNVDVVVENKRGELLLGLTKGNFQVRVNGKMVEGADVVDSSDELAAGLLLDISTSMFSEGVQRTDRIGWAKGAML